MEEDCIFCKIVKGEIPCIKIYEDKEFLAFMDAFPVKTGQVLVIPKKHLPYVFNLEDTLYKKLMIISKEIANAIDKSLKPIKTGMIIEGLEINHAHVKLFPLTESFGLHAMEPKPSEEEIKELAQKIKEGLTDTY